MDVTDKIRPWMKECRLCPRNCGADRMAGQKGFCGTDTEIMVARAALHMWEEPCISGEAGSGAVFFAGCSLRCIYCQNFELARGRKGFEVGIEQLADIFLALQGKGAANINLVTPDHFTLAVIPAVRMARERGLMLPVIYNCSGYEKEELIESGYIRRKGGSKKVKITSRPFHYISSDGFSMYVGKNNLQNEELTFKFAVGNDWWFHAKGRPGSHVIVKTGGKELPDATFEEAARLAAHYSTGRDQEKIEVDYVEKKQVKKVAGAKPGFVIYHTNYSMVISTDISGIRMAED